MVDFWAIRFRRAHSLLRKVKLRYAVGGGGDSPPVVPLQFKLPLSGYIQRPDQIAMLLLPYGTPQD